VALLKMISESVHAKLIVNLLRESETQISRSGACLKNMLFRR
jgi:hypothetical protein